MWHTEAKHAGILLKGEGWGGDGQSLLYEQLIVAGVDDVLPGATSLNVAAPFKLFVVYGPKGPKVILDSYKALVQGEVSAHSTLERGGDTEGGREGEEQPGQMQ